VIESGYRTMTKFRAADEYFAGLPKPARERLEKLRALIRETAPEAEEVISYNIPAFRQTGILVWYAAFHKHIGLYPKASAMAAFKTQLADYKTSKGAIQFPIERPIPASLVKKIIKFRLKENEQRAKQRAGLG